jgi:hypothetical protein
MTKKIILAAGAVVWVFAATASRGGAQSAAIAQVPGITATCTVPAGEKAVDGDNQTPTCRALEALAAMTQDEKLAFRGFASPGWACSTAAVPMARTASPGAADGAGAPPAQGRLE